MEEVKNLEKSRYRHLQACIVKDCAGKNSKGIRLFRVPTVDRDIWCKNLKISKDKIKTTARICSRHFEPEWIGSMKLKVGARPTLYLGHEDYEAAPLRKDCFYTRKCSIAGCSATRPPCVLFSFPKDKELLQQWLQICQIKEEMKKNMRQFICKSHFDPSMFSKKSLRKSALPLPTVGSFVKIEADETSILVEPETEWDYYPSCNQCAILRKRLRSNTQSHNIENIRLKRKIALLQSERDEWKTRYEELLMVPSKQDTKQELLEISDVNLDVNHCNELQMKPINVQNEADGIDGPAEDYSNSQYELLLLDSIKEEYRVTRS